MLDGERSAGTVFFRCWRQRSGLARPVGQEEERARGRGGHRRE